MSHVVIEQVYSTLMALDPDAKPYPELAESHEVSEDGLTYTFKLRQNVQFHNGDELTADDVKFSFDRLRAKDFGYSYGAQVETIASVDVVDPHTVQFKLSKRTGPFLIYMAFPGSSIVPKKLVELGHDLNAKPVGSGPFKFVSYQPRQAIVFEKNPNYFEAGKPYFDKMEYRIISDITALTNAVMSGEVNFSNEIPPKDWATIQANPDLVGVTLEGSRYNWLLCNTGKKPLDNPKVRQAIAQAIDREALVKGAFFGQATPILGGVIPSWNWAYADIQYFKPSGDPEKAKALLAEAGSSRRIRDLHDHRILVSRADGDGAHYPGKPGEVGIKAKIGTMEIPRFWDEVWSHQQFRHHHHVLAVAARRSRRFPHQQLQMRHVHQRAKILQSADGRSVGEGQERGHGSGARGTLQAGDAVVARRHGSSSSRQRLAAHRAHARSFRTTSRCALDSSRP